MKSLDRRIFRDLKSNIGKYLAIFILMTATIAFSSGFLSVADSVEKTLKDIEETPDSLTGQYLSGRKKIEVPAKKATFVPSGEINGLPESSISRT